MSDKKQTRYWLTDLICVVLFLIIVIWVYGEYFGYVSVRDFIFYSISKSSTDNSTELDVLLPSLFSILVPALTGIFAFTGLSFLNRRTIATEQQVIIADQNHKFEKSIEYEKQLDNAIKDLNPDNDPINWQRGLSRIVTLINHSPDEFSEFGITQLVKTAELFSVLNVMKNVHEQETTTWDSLNNIEKPEINEFIFEVLNALQKLFVILDKKNMRFPVYVLSNLKIYPNRTNRKFLLQHGFFEGIFFENCIFSGVRFRYCNFIDANADIFFEAELVHSLIDYNFFIDDESRSVNEVDINFCFFWQPNETDFFIEDVARQFGGANANNVKMLPYKLHLEWQNNEAPRPFFQYQKRAIVLKSEMLQYTDIP